MKAMIFSLAVLSGALTARAASFEDIVKKYELTEYSTTLGRYVPNTRFGQLTKEALVLSPFRSTPSDEGKMLSSAVKQLIEGGDASLTVFEHALKTMPVTMHSERQFLIGLVSVLKADDQKKAAVLTDEVRRSNTRSGDDAVLHTAAGIIALNELEKVSHNGPALEPLVRESVDARSQRPELQQMIVDHYEFIAPDAAKRIRGDYRLPKPTQPERPTQPPAHMTPVPQ